MKKIIPFFIATFLIYACQKDKDNEGCDNTHIIAGSTMSNCYSIINVFDTIMGNPFVYEHFDIYIDNDTIPEFRLGCGYGSPILDALHYEIGLVVFNPNISICMASDSNYVKLFSKNEIINKSNIWKNEYPFHLSSYTLYNDRQILESINVNVKNKYIGFRYINDTDTIYNWLKITISVKGDKLFIQNYTTK